MSPDTEPVRLGGWVALLVGLSLSAVVQWALGADVKVIVGGAATTALSVIGGLEWARGQAWSPASHQTAMSMERALR